MPVFFLKIVAFWGRGGKQANFSGLLPLTVFAPSFNLLPARQVVSAQLAVYTIDFI
jgi:hypothetical protein